ncbi:MAG TPA: hypothetical protein VFG07_02020 [Thermoplasmata archaeon]|nr:hypothetical protein [Thermoplasmata archaeon]
MRIKVDPGLTALFGSEGRVKTLAALANADAPLTAYRVAAIAGMNPPNVYRELKRLVRYNEVARSPTPQGALGWTLIDANVRALLRRRLRIVWSEDLFRGAAERGRRATLAARRSSRVPLDLSEFGPGRPPSAAAVRRRVEKDRVLRAAGARTSARAQRTTT